MKKLTTKERELLTVLKPKKRRKEARKKNEFDNQLMITDDLNEMIVNDAIIL